MIFVLLFGDGPRDAAMIPPLLESLLGVRVRVEFTAWARLHHQGSRSGYQRKLLFAMRQAQDKRANGMVATVDVDSDRRREKLRELQEARDKARQKDPPFPTVLGEASPHAEAWLLDDPVAVRRALRLSGNAAVPLSLAITRSSSRP